VAAVKNLNIVMAHKKIKIFVSIAVFIALFFVSNFAQAQSGEVTVEADSMLKVITNNRVWSRPEKISGYRILLHNGNKLEAEKVAADFKALFPNQPLIMKWDEPNFKVLGGMFYTRAEAKEYMSKCSRKFPMLIIVNDLVDLPPVDPREEEDK